MRNSQIAFVGRIALILILSLTWLGPASADASRVGQENPLLARVQTPDYQLTAEGVEVPGYALHATPGAPRLPLTGVTFELPDSGDWQLSFESSDSRILDERVAVAAVPVPNFEFPSLFDPSLMMEELSGSVPVVDRPDASIYGVDAFYPASPVVAGEVVVQGGRRILPVRIFPFQYNPVTRQLRYHSDLLITVQVRRGVDAVSSTATQSLDFYQPTVLPGDGVLRIHTKERGLYHLTPADLSAEGLTVGEDGVNPNTFAIYYKGQQIDIQVTGASDNTFDPGDMVIFYAVPYDGGRYQNYNIYHFVWGNGVSPQPMLERTVTAPGAPPAVSVIRQTLRMETDKTYYTNLDRPSDADHFLDDPLEVKTADPVVKTYELALNSPVTTEGNVEIKALLYGGKNQAANPDQSVLVKLNSHAVGTYQWEGNREYQVTASVSSSWLDGAPTNQVILEADKSQLPSLPSLPSKPCASDDEALCYYWIWPDWLEVSYPALANAVDDRLYIENFENLVLPDSPVAAAGFSSSTVTVIDVSEPASPQRLAGFGVQSSGGLNTVYWTEDTPNSSYALSTDAGLREPGVIERIDRGSRPAAWASPQTYDYIAIVGMERSYNGTTALGSQLRTALEGLVTHRTADGFNVAVIPVEDIYDEWSYSRIDPMAIRSFFRYAYLNWRNSANEPPGYGLLVGDGHYDFNKVTTQPLPNLVPPYLADADFIGEAPVDNLYVSVDSLTDFLPDIALGRMPVNTVAELTAIIAKITAYESTAENPSGDWQKLAVYGTGDCNDHAGNLHTLSNNGRLTWLPTAYTNQRFYFDASGDGVVCPDGNHTSATTMRPAIRQAFGNGAFYMQWLGHGSQTSWGGGGTFLAVNDFYQQLVPETAKFPFSAAYACMTGYFIFHSPFASRQTLAELQVSTPQRGSIADFSPSGKHLASDASNLQISVHKALFHQRKPRAGDVIDAAKQDFYAAGGGSNVINTMIFFGDPAVKLRYAVDISTSTLGVDQNTASPGAILDYTLTVRNSSIFPASQLTVVVDYPETQATVSNAPGATNSGSTLTWNLPDLPAGDQHLLNFSLQESAGGRAPASYDLIVPATVSSQMAPDVNLQTSTTIESALAVTLDYFNGVANYPTHISLEWQSVSELNNAGFNLYRTGSADSQPAPADLLAYLPSQAPGSTAGAAYSFQDSNVVAGQTYWYWLEDVDLNGEATLHGPISVSYNAPTAVTLVEMQAASSGILPSSILLLALAVALVIGGIYAARRVSIDS